MAQNRRFPIAVACSLAALVACSGTDRYNPGEPIGTFHVTGKLTSTTCGPTPDPWEFDVRLRHDHSTLFWVQGGAPISGGVDAQAHALLSTEAVTNVRAANPNSKLPACNIVRSDALDVTLTADEGPPSDLGEATAFAGTLVYRFAPTSGSECADQLTAVGGDFDALPCEVHYDVSAARTGDALP